MAKRKKTDLAISFPQISLNDAIVQGIMEKKGKEITILNLKNLHHAMFDSFVICHGTSSTQVSAIADSVEDEVYKLTGLTPAFKEGFTNAEWILLDYIDVVVHIFQENTRRFFHLENLWADAEVKRIVDLD